MAEWLVSFHFLRPWFLLLLIIPLWWLIKSFKSGTNTSSWEKVIDARLLSYLLIKGSSSQRQIMAWLAGIGLLFAIVAAAGPSWEKEEVQALELENPLMIALNLSSDMENKDISPSRLARAKFKLQDLLLQLKDVQTGLMVYASEPFVISPFSDDANIIVNLLPAINLDIMPQNGDRIDRAIELSVDKFQATEYIKGNILLVTSDAGQGFEQALQNAKKARALGYNVSVLSITKKVNEKLQMIAEAGGGQYIQLASDDTDIKEVIKVLGSVSAELNKAKNWQSVWLDYGYYLLLVPMFCCLYFFRKGIFVLMFLLLATNAEAGFFLNDNQEGYQAFNNDDFVRAEQKFTIPEWKGASLYRQGNYDKAYLEFAKGNSETDLYNQGNALAKGGKIEEAIAKYEEVLKINPMHEDAKFNLEYLKKQQNQQQKQKQQNQKQEQEQNQEQQNQEQQSGAADNQENDADNEQKQQETNSGAGDKEQNENTEMDKENENEQQNSNNSQSQSLGEDKIDEEQSQTQSAGALQNGEENQEYDEKIQAMAQQYREIPEDIGGLLRAFIRKEYELQRYNNKR